MDYLYVQMKVDPQIIKLPKPTGIVLFVTLPWLYVDNLVQVLKAKHVCIWYVSVCISLISHSWETYWVSSFSMMPCYKTLLYNSTNTGPIQVNNYRCYINPLDTSVIKPFGHHCYIKPLGHPCLRSLCPYTESPSFHNPFTCPSCDSIPLLASTFEK